MTYEGQPLTEGTEYTLVYSANTAAGTGKVTLTGQGRFGGTTTASFAVRPRDISDAVATLDETAFDYNGTALKPAVTAVALDGATVNTYTTSYESNVDVGTGRVPVTGYGNYTGTAKGTFEIIDRDALETLNLPAALLTVGEEAFMGVSAQRITVPGNCTAIGARAFASCEALTLVELPASVTDIAADAFQGSPKVCILAPQGSEALAWAKAHDLR